MNPLEIVLIIIGIIIIIISCRLVDKSSKKAGQLLTQPFSFDHNISEEDKRKLTNKLELILSDLSEEAIVRTDDLLSKISNEKIMAVSEYSDQILEKINRNHEEVVFLYNMLNDKEKELKVTVKELEQSKKKILGNGLDQKEVNPLQSEVGDKTSLDKKSATAYPIAPTAIVKDGEMEPSADDTSESGSENKNKQILLLHSKGKTIMEISKLLGLGQGEVKLVIDLYKSKK